MTLCAFPPSDEMRKCADPLASGFGAGHHADMEHRIITLDRALRMEISDPSGATLASLKLSRGVAESLASALLQFCGNQVGGLSDSSSVAVQAMVIAQAADEAS